MNKRLQDNKPIVFQLTRKRHKPALAGRFYPLQFRLPSTEEVYDRESNKTRMIRYAIGETSIFKDEQAEKVKLADIVFQNGKIVVSHTNPNLLRFLELSNHFIGNPDKIRGKEVIFRKIDHSISAKVNVDGIVLESQAVAAVLAMDFPKLKGMARVMGKRIDKSSDEILHDMILFAKKDPKGFLDGIDNPLTARKETILTAREYNLILFSGRSVKWNIGDTKGVIVNAPVGANTLDFFADWTMRDKDGEEVYAEIEKRIAKMTEE